MGDMLKRERMRLPLLILAAALCVWMGAAQEIEPPAAACAGKDSLLTAGAAAGRVVPPAPPPEPEQEPELEPERYYIPGIPLSRELQEFTYQLCREKQISYELVLAVMQRESRFRTDVQGHNRNGSTDSGLMQINSCNAGWLEQQLGIADLMDPQDNIRAGVHILAGHISLYGENDGLMAYHMGAGGMLKAKRNGTTSTAYSRAVLEQRDVIAALPKAA